LSLKELQIDRSSFLVNKLELENLTILIRPKQADTTKGKNVVIGDPGTEKDAESTPSLKVVMEKLFNGEETITITIRGSTMGHHERKAKGSTSAHNDKKRKPTAANQEQAIKPPLDRSDRHGRPKQATQHRDHTTHRVGRTVQLQDKAPRMIKTRSPKAEKWKVNEGRDKRPTFKPTFDYLLNKYTKASPNDRAMKWPRPPVRQEHREQPKQVKPEAKGKKTPGERYDLKILQPACFVHPFGYPSASSSTGLSGSQMQ
jgi:hypothetical protein